jgi:putative DNA primase/helicase
VLSLSRTLPTAEAYVEAFHQHTEGRTLHYYAGMLFEWHGNRYQVVEAEALKHRLQPWLHDALRYVTDRSGQQTLEPFSANPHTVNAAHETIRSYVYLPNDTLLSSWLRPREGDPPAFELLPCRTHNVHIPTGAIIPPTPRLFNTNALEFDYDPAAAVPGRWLTLLEELWDDDQESIDLLQEWFGYCLTVDTTLQKALLIVGPRRGGKGTIARVLTRLVGPSNVAGPTTGSLAGTFGLQPLIDKSLAIISDARFSGEHMPTVVERVLAITGEDLLTVDRKHHASISLKLPTRRAHSTGAP